MSKVKSAIITAILVAALIVATLFAVISFPVAGSNGVERIDSIASRVSLGGEFTGEAYKIIYPEGVIPKSQYDRALPVFDESDPDKEDKQEKLDEYKLKYVACGDYYVESDLVAELDGEGAIVKDTNGNGVADEEKLSDFRASVAKDVSVIADRFDKRDFLNCSVSLVDGFAIRISVPSQYNGSSYGYRVLKDSDFVPQSDSNDVETRISSSMQFLTLGGELSLRNNGSGIAVNDAGAGILSRYDEDVASWFTSVTAVTRGGTSYISVRLTDGGFSRLKDVVSNINSSDDYSEKNILFFVGETNILNLSVEGGSLEQTFNIQVSDKDTAQNYETIFNSVIRGDVLAYDYGGTNQSIIYLTPALGEKAALLLGITALIIVVAAAAFPFIRYKKLAIVNAISVFGYSLVMLYAIYLLGITVTFAGIITALSGLALMTFSNIRAFESVREETKKGKTMQASVKSGYRAVLSSLLDLYILLLLASIIVALVPVGEVAACGFIFFIGVLASYAFYWITRFTWYVISSPVRDKFKFGGYKREVADDE